MGLSIHYSGSFRNGACLSDMIEEVKDIAEVYKWKYSIFEEKFPENSFGKTSYNQNIYGISFTSPNCETVSLTFLSNGKISSSVHLKFYGKTNDKSEQDYLYMLSVKTQFAGIEVHKFIIHLFRYLDKKYFQDLKIFDEGKYWETGDEKLLQEIFNQYTDLSENVTSAIEIYPMNTGETFESYFKRLIKNIHNKTNGD